MDLSQVGKTHMQPLEKAGKSPNWTSMHPQGFPVKTKLYSRGVCGTSTDFSFSAYEDHLLLIITQLGTSGTVISTSTVSKMTKFQLTRAHARTHAHTYIHTHTHTHMRTHVHTHTHTHKHTHTKTHMHTNTHTHTLNIAPKQHAKLAQACSSRSSSDSNNSKREYICTVSLFITTHMDMKHRGHQRIKFGPDDCMVLR